MVKNFDRVSAAAAHAKRSNSTMMVATATAQGLKWQVRNQDFIDGYGVAVRNCAEALLFEGYCDREYVASVFECREIPFPSTDDTIWDTSWEFDDWDEWVAAEESESDYESV